MTDKDATAAAIQEEDHEALHAYSLLGIVVMYQATHYFRHIKHERVS